MSVTADAIAAGDVLGTITLPIEDTKIAAKRVSSLPPVTTSSSEDYIEACARSNQKASLRDPLTALFQAEKLPLLPDEAKYIHENGTSRPACSALWNRLSRVSQDEIEGLIYDASINRLRSKVSVGAFVAEAGNWAATAAWEPVFAPPPPADIQPSPDCPSTATALFNGSISEPWFQTMQSLMLREQKVSDIYAEKPIYGEFVTRIEMARQEHLYPILWKEQKLGMEDRSLDVHSERAIAIADGEDQKHLLFWHLSLTSRNPAVQPPVPGAVRAVIEPFVKKWVDEIKMPAVWLEAGSERARDVYGYLGFRVVDEIVVGEDEHGNGIKTWCMIYTRDE